MKRPVIALSPIFLVFTGITSFPGPLPAFASGKQQRVRTGGSANQKARKLYLKSQLLRVILRQFPLGGYPLIDLLDAQPATKLLLGPNRLNPPLRKGGGHSISGQ